MEKEVDNIFSLLLFCLRMHITAGAIQRKNAISNGFILFYFCWEVESVFAYEKWLWFILDVSMQIIDEKRKKRRHEANCES